MSADSGNSSPYSEVATEPIPEHEQLQLHEYMSRRSIFLSDFERYNPVQNMQMLAHHVFELSEGVGRLKNDFTDSRRLLQFVATNQRQHDASIRAVGSDLEKFSDGIGAVSENMGGVEHKVDVVRSELKDDIGGLREDINSLRTEMNIIRQETQQGIMDLKQMLMMFASPRA